MRKSILISFLIFVAVHANGQENIQLSDLVGKWKLTKVEESQMRGDTEYDRQVFTSVSYSGEILFEGFECTSDGNLSYSGKMIEGLRDGGNIQLNGSNEVFFHGKQGDKQVGLLLMFSWQNEPVEFTLEKILQGNQQSAEKKMVRYYYKKEE